MIVRASDLVEAWLDNLVSWMATQTALQTLYADSLLKYFNNNFYGVAISLDYSSFVRSNLERRKQ